MELAAQPNKKLYNILYTIFILANLVLNVRLFVLDLYALLVGLHIINRIKWENSKELLYHLVLLFSVMDFTFNLPLFGRFNIYYFHIALFVLTVLLFFSWLKSRPNLSLKLLTGNKYILFLTVFILYMLLSVTWATSKGLAIKYVINYAIEICFMIAVYYFNPTPAKMKESLKTLFLASILVLVLGSFELAGIRMPVRTIFSDHGWYVKGPFYLKTIPEVFFYNPNNYAVYLLMFMSYLVPLIVFGHKSPYRWLLLILQIDVLLNLIFTTSRTVYFAMFLTLLGFVLFFLLNREKEKTLVALKVSAITLVIFYALSFVPALDVYYGKFNDTPILNLLSIHARKAPVDAPIVAFGEEGSANQRYTIIVDVLRGVFKEGHWYGFGVNNTTMYLASVHNTHGITNPHSLWFEILGDFGVIILAYLIYIYLSLLWDLLKIYRLAIQGEPYGFVPYLAVSLIAALGGFILTAFAPSSVISFSPMWFLYGLAAVLILRQKDFLQDSELHKVIG